ncbi:endolytic transglycosylase MltG [Colwelliaceae bacterium 6471]
MLKKIALFVTILLSILVLSFFLMLDHQMNTPINIDQEEFVEVKTGTSVSSFSKALVNQHWLTNRFWLRAYVRINPDMANLKSGMYKIMPGTSLVALLNKIVAGEEHQFKVTFIEGSTFKQWLSILAQQKHLKHTLHSASIDDIAKKLQIEHKNPEGWFYPDTYAYTSHTTDLALLQRAYQRMQTELETLWATRAENLPFDTPYQGLILASIIEKESSKVDELPLIASVFINRLYQKMRLQTDPTVIYGLGDRYQGDIKRSHLREKTLYNTYRIDGLPPTPIAMPGKMALQAALAPISSDYLYFVSKGDGYHKFSTTLAEHNRAVAEFILNKNK